MYDVKKVYYALTEKEAKKAFIDIQSKIGFKGIHLSIDGLKKFIKDHKIVDLPYYVEVPLTQFEIKEGIFMDPKYNMVAVKTPFSVIVKGVKTLS